MHNLLCKWIFTENHIFSHERRLFDVITWRSSACNKRPHRIYCNKTINISKGRFAPCRIHRMGRNGEYYGRYKNTMARGVCVGNEFGAGTEQV